MAIAEAHLAARFNRPGHEVVDHHTFVLASDGDLMEGVAHEAASLAGHLRLGKLIVSLRRQPRHAVAARRRSRSPRTSARASRPTGGTSQRVADGNDLDGDRARAARRDRRDRPAVADHRRAPCIGYGAPEQERHVRGARLAARRRRRSSATKRNLGWPTEPAFFVPDEARGACSARRLRAGARARGGLAAAVRRVRARVSRAGGRARAPVRGRAARRAGTRPAGCSRPTTRGWRRARLRRRVLQRAGAHAAGADRRLGRSRSVDVHCAEGSGDFEPESTSPTARRARSAAAGATPGATSISACASTRWARRSTGSPITAAVIPFGATFLVFSDYMRPAIRLAALVAAARRSSSSRTTASAWARTGRRTRRSSSWRRCARFRICS